MFPIIRKSKTGNKSQAITDVRSLSFELEKSPGRLPTPAPRLLVGKSVLQVWSKDPVASAPPESLLEMQRLRPHLRLAESQSSL